jgi:hypothetical protein
MEAGKNKLSRRTMIAGLSVGAASLGGAAFATLNGARSLSRDGDQDSWWSSRPIALERAAMLEWSGRIGEEFKIAAGEKAASYKLATVTALPSIGERPAEVARRRAFLLVFETEGEGAGDGNTTYNVSHANGVLDIFFDPSEGESPKRLSAVFN